MYMYMYVYMYVLYNAMEITINLDIFVLQLFCANISRIIFVV